ncbi:uncharacterized protein DEA37_0012338, partial [Paragonimus westermani]
NAEQYKSTPVNACYKFQDTVTPGCGLLKQSHIETIKELQSNHSIILTKPDKEAGVILLDKADYVEKMHHILFDQSKFRKMKPERDKTTSIENSLSKQLCQMKQTDLIDGIIFKTLSSLDPVHQ